MKFAKTLLALGIFIAMGCQSVNAQESLPQSEILSPAIPKTETPIVDTTDSVQPSDTKVSGWTPVTQTIADSLLLLKTIFQVGNQKGEAYSELQQEYPGISFADAKPLAQAFEANEVRANRDYKGKWMWIVGTISKISDHEDAGPSLLIKEMGGGNSFMTYFPNSEQDRDEVAKLELKQPVSLVCKLVSFNLVGITMDSCQFLDLSTLKAWKSSQIHIQEALEHKGDPINALSSILIPIMIETELQPEQEKACEQNALQCLITLLEDNFFDKFGKFNESKGNEILERLEALGYSKQWFEDTFKNNETGAKTFEEALEKATEFYFNQ